MLVLVVTNANDADDDDGSSTIRACLVMESAFGACFVGGRGENEATSERLLEATEKMMAAEENLMGGYSLGCATCRFCRRQANRSIVIAVKAIPIGYEALELRKS